MENNYRRCKYAYWEIINNKDDHDYVCHKYEQTYLCCCSKTCSGYEPVEKKNE